MDARLSPSFPPPRAAYHSRVLLVKETEQNELISCTAQRDAIARHRLSEGRNQRLVEPAHYQGIISRASRPQSASAT